jgi:NADH-quinone oxidoreductase subunit C
MDDTAVAAALQEILPGAHIESAPGLDLQATLYVGRDDLIAVARELRDRPEFAFTLLIELTAVDYWPRDPRYEVVYLLVSIARRRRLRVKVRLSADDARVATVTDIWPAANWLEREVWDLFGIVFEGHPDPRRLLMPEDWDGHPLRKDHPLQIRLTPQTAEPMQVTAEEFRANVENDRRARR